MKTCKSCIKEIDEKAKKCPYCQTDQRNFFSRHKLLSGLLIFTVFVFMGISGNSGTSSKSTSQQLSPSPLADEQWINDMAKKYYDSHINMRWSPTQFYGGSLTPDVAKRLVKQCIDELESKDKCQQIVEKKFWIDMPEVWATMSVGNPDRINTTVVKGLTQKQYVYGDPLYKATYLYFYNDILVSYQQ